MNVADEQFGIHFEELLNCQSNFLSYGFVSR
jgi:hypothetical protein